LCRAVVAFCLFFSRSTEGRPQQKTKMNSARGQGREEKGGKGSRKKRAVHGRINTDCNTPPRTGRSKFGIPSYLVPLDPCDSKDTVTKRTYLKKTCIEPCVLCMRKSS
jgi:hypothetical protein